MKILPLAKIAAAKKRLIEQTKEMNVMKIDVDALWAKAWQDTGRHAEFKDHFDREVKGQYGEWKDVPIEMKP